MAKASKYEETKQQQQRDVCHEHDPQTGTVSYVLADPATRMAAIVDPVLDFDAASGRTARTSADRLLSLSKHGAKSSECDFNSPDNEP